MTRTGLLDRWRLLWAARRDLRRGAAESALERLRDPRVADRGDARELRAAAVDRLCQDARRRAAEGRDESVVRLLGAVEREDPERAEHWRARLFGPRDPGPDETEDSGTLEELLARLRREPPAVPAAAPEGAGAADEPGPRPEVLRLGVDDGGEHLLVIGTQAVLGHGRGGRADLPFLADVAPEHARIAYRGASFHAGSRWTVEPVGDQRLLVNGRLVEGRAAAVGDGDAVSLGPNLTFLFRQPDPASSAAVCELATEGDCLGARELLLVAEPGRVGGARIGSVRACHVRVARPGVGARLTLEDGELALRGESPLGSISGAVRVVSPTEIRVALPLAGRVDLSLAAPDGAAGGHGLYLAGVQGR